MADWINNGPESCRCTFGGDWVAMVWPDPDEGQWRWRVATFGRDAGEGICVTEDEAKRAAAAALAAVAGTP